MGVFINGVQQGNEGGSAGNVSFPATQVPSADANTFDDYEEGTFTPTVLDTSLSAAEGQAYTTQVGRYTKLGNRVTIQIRVQISDLGCLTTGDSLVVGGLPFTTLNLASSEASFVVGTGGTLAIAAGVTVTGLSGINVSYINMNLWDATTGVTSMLVSELSADGRLHITGIYEV